LQPHNDEYEVELGNLSSLKLLQHPNIVRLLGSYTYRKKHNLVFPEATGGTLESLLARKRPSHFREDGSFVLALSGLASAVDELHNFFIKDLPLSKIGCHHDLRLANILVEQDQFVLADFGLARFKDSTESSDTMFKVGQGYYLAPECQNLGDGFKRRPVRRSSDIWSFGCVIADVVTYMVKGAAGVAQFRQTRKFQIATNVYFYFHCGDRENNGVSSWLTELEDTPSRDVQMLVALTRKMLDMDHTLRPTSKEVVNSLRFIALHSFVSKISQQYETLQEQVFPSEASVEPYIEQKRFWTWCRALGFCGELDMGIPAREDFNFEWFQSTVRLLKILLQELHSLQSQALDVRRRVLMPLRHLNSLLLELLPQALQAQARDCAEHQILGTNDLRLLEKLQRSEVGTLQILVGAKMATILARDLPPPIQCSMRLNKYPVMSQVQLGHHNIGEMKDLISQKDYKVLVEYKFYDDPLLRERLFARMEGIAKLSNSIQDPEKLHILHCRGYFHDPDRFAFGLVYDFPNPGSSMTATSLQQMLADPRREFQPNLGQRFQLGYALAAALFNFHKIGWLHKGISSSNMAFFHGSETTLMEALMVPYVLGFRYSRPHEVATFTEGVPLVGEDDKYCQHPEYIQNNDVYTFKHDYYSLGIVLLELGLWKPLMKMGRFSGLSIEAFREQLVNIVVPRLGLSMGNTYRDAVKATLGSEFDQDDNISDEEQRKSATQFRFETLVLNKLRGLAAFAI
jgi:serine/threonine protein kinase